MTMRRWLKRIGLGALGMAAAIVVAGSGYEAFERRQAASAYPPTGRLVDIGGRRMHIDCRGSGSPTVIFEAGLTLSGSLSWSKVFDPVASFTRACVYDRAGILWSDPKSGPQDAGAISRDLKATLDAAGVAGPLVLVAHSIGGPYATTFTQDHGDRVAGLVFVDTSHPDQIARFRRATGADMHPRAMVPTMKAIAALSWMGAVRLAVGGKEPPKGPPAIIAETTALSHRSIVGAISELEGFDRTMARAGAARDLGKRPLFVLTGVAPYSPEILEEMHLNPRQGVRFQQELKSLHDDQASWSTRSRHRVLTDANHYVQIDRPDAVIDATRQVVDAVRRDSATGGLAAAP